MTKHWWDGEDDNKCCPDCGGQISDDADVHLAVDCVEVLLAQRRELARVLGKLVPGKGELGMLGDEYAPGDRRLLICLARPGSTHDFTLGELKQAWELLQKVRHATS